MAAVVGHLFRVDLFRLWSTLYDSWAFAWRSGLGLDQPYPEQIPEDRQTELHTGGSSAQLSSASALDTADWGDYALAQRVALCAADAVFCFQPVPELFL